MHTTRTAAMLIPLLLAPALAAAAPLEVTARANPAKVVGKGSSVIAIRVTDAGTPVASQAVSIDVVEGFECGSPNSRQATTTEDGTITTVLFTGADYVENCQARIRVRAVPAAVEGAAAPPEAATAETTVTVSPDVAAANIDGLGAIALVLILSFAIDRLVRGTLFVLSYWKPWAARFPDPELDDVPQSARGAANLRFVYVLMAGALGIVALGWFGQIRILSALGFGAVDPWLDILVTGLVVMGGADRTEHVLRSLGASGAPPRGAEPMPIHVTGRMTLEEQGPEGTVSRRATLGT